MKIKIRSELKTTECTARISGIIDSIFRLFSGGKLCGRVTGSTIIIYTKPLRHIASLSHHKIAVYITEKSDGVEIICDEYIPNSVIIPYYAYFIISFISAISGIINTFSVLIATCCGSFEFFPHVVFLLSLSFIFVNIAIITGEIYATRLQRKIIIDTICNSVDGLILNAAASNLQEA